MKRRLGPTGPSWTLGDQGFMEWCYRVLYKREKRLQLQFCTLYSSLIIVKSLQLHGRRQIAEPHKYCLVHVIVCLWRVFSLFVLFLTGWDFQFNSLQLVLEPRVRFEWEQWQRKQERRLEQKCLMAQTLRIGGCRLKIISMGGNCICLFQGENLRL